jgi:hypothetical protein
MHFDNKKLSATVRDEMNGGLQVSTKGKNDCDQSIQLVVPKVQFNSINQGLQDC